MSVAAGVNRANDAAERFSAVNVLAVVSYASVLLSEGFE